MIMKKPYTPLPWHYSEKGFSLKKPMPTIYATNSDLEIVARVPFDGNLHERIQDNKQNAEYIVHACNRYPDIMAELQTLRNTLINLHTARWTGNGENFAKIIDRIAAYSYARTNSTPDEKHDKEMQRLSLEALNKPLREESNEG